MGDPAVTDSPELPVVPATLSVGSRWIWEPYDAAWIRIYHRDPQTPSAVHRRTFGPLHRFDHHLPPPDEPAVCAEGRSATYLAKTLRAAASETFGELDPFRVCPHWHLARLRVEAPLLVQDLTGSGGMAIGAGPWLGSSPPEAVPRTYTQKWARKIYDATDLHGIRYTGSHEEGACLAIWDRAPGMELVVSAGIPCDISIQEAEIWDDVVSAYAETGRSLTKIGEDECKRCQRMREASGA